MDTQTAAEVVVRNAPPLVVAGASFSDWFLNFPIAVVAQWGALIWIVIQAGFYLYDRYRKWKNGRDK